HPLLHPGRICLYEARSAEDGLPPRGVRAAGAVLLSRARTGGVDRPGQPHLTAPRYQTWQAFLATMGWPALQPQAFWNSGMLETTPFTRYLSGECSLVWAMRRVNWSVMFSHQIWPHPRNSLCCGV